MLRCTVAVHTAAGMVAPSAYRHSEAQLPSCYLQLSWRGVLSPTQRWCLCTQYIKWAGVPTKDQYWNHTAAINLTKAHIHKVMDSAGMLHALKGQ